MSKDFQLYAKAESVDADLGLVFGWGIICTEHGEPYFDTQGDHIPENSMLEAVSDFMKSARVSLDQHQGSQVGQVVHSFPMTKGHRACVRHHLHQDGLDGRREGAGGSRREVQVGRENRIQHRRQAHRR